MPAALTTYLDLKIIDNVVTLLAGFNVFNNLYFAFFALFLLTSINDIKIRLLSFLGFNAFLACLANIDIFLNSADMSICCS